MRLEQRDLRDRARHAFRQAETHARALVVAPGMERFEFELDSLGRRTRADDARVR